jgi:DNA-binding NtrC family response regulator
MDADRNRRTVLIVEDEALIRLDIALTLELAGFCTLEAGSSAEGLAILAHHDEIGVVITGINMPGEMNGLALVRRIIQAHPSICSIVMSGNAPAQDAYEAGATDFISKRFMVQTFVGTVHTAFRRHEMRQKGFNLPDARQ